MNQDEDRFDKKPKKLKRSKNIRGVGMRTIGQPPEECGNKWYIQEELDDSDDGFGPYDPEDDQK